MPGRVPGPARPMHNGGNGQIPTRVVDAISQLPFVRSVTTWRRRTDPETDLDPTLHLAQVLGQVNPKATVTTTFSAFSREKVPVMRSEEHTSELQSLMRISYAVFCLKKKKEAHTRRHTG